MIKASEAAERQRKYLPGEEECSQPSPLANLTEPRCYLPQGHPPPHRFRSHDGRTDLEQFPKEAKS